MSEATSTRDPISSIPLEVRNMIWTFLLVPNKHIDICYSTTPSPNPDSQVNPQLQVVKSLIPAPSILRVSKAIHAEAEKILYNFNVFEFNKPSAPDDLRFFFQEISSRAYLFLTRHIVMYWPPIIIHEFQIPLDFLVGCYGLKNLTCYGLPVYEGRIPMLMESWMSGIRVQAVKFPDTEPHLVSALSQLIEGKGRKRTEDEEDMALEDRQPKVIYLY
jgi:hypothetical protein